MTKSIKTFNLGKKPKETKKGKVYQELKFRGKKKKTKRKKVDQDLQFRIKTQGNKEWKSLSGLSVEEGKIPRKQRGKKLHQNLQFKHSFAFASPRTQGRDRAQDGTAVQGVVPLGITSMLRYLPPVLAFPWRLQSCRNDLLQWSRCGLPRRHSRIYSLSFQTACSSRNRVGQELRVRLKEKLILKTPKH